MVSKTILAGLPILAELPAVKTTCPTASEGVAVGVVHPVVVDSSVVLSYSESSGI